MRITVSFGSNAGLMNSFDLTHIAVIRLVVLHSYAHVEMDEVQR